MMGRDVYGEAKEGLMSQTTPLHLSNSSGVSVIAWACVAASGSESLVFIDVDRLLIKVTVKSKVYRVMLSVQIQ